MSSNNWFNIMQRQKKLTFFTASFDQFSTVFPYIVVSPAYFAGQVQLGALDADRVRVRQRADMRCRFSSPPIANSPNGAR